MKTLFDIGPPVPAKAPDTPQESPEQKPNLHRIGFFLKLSKGQREALELKAEDEGRSLREFLKMRLLKSTGLME